MKRARTKQPDQTPHMRLEKIIEWCQAIDTGAAREIAQAAHRLMQTCDMPATEQQKEIRKMCGAWNVDRGGGKKGERRLSALKQELQAKLAKGASKLHWANEPTATWNPVDGVTASTAEKWGTLSAYHRIHGNGCAENARGGMHPGLMPH